MNHDSTHSSVRPRRLSRVTRTAHAIWSLLCIALLGAGGNAHALLAADFTMVKTANPTTFTAVGQQIIYTYVITNVRDPNDPSPNSILLTLTDNKIGAIDVNTCVGGGQNGNPPNFFGKTITCTASYTITAADLAAGSVTNIASGTGDSCRDGCVRGFSATAAIALGASWTLAVTPSPTTYSAAGTTINYSFLLTNTGGVNIGSITITDTKVTTVTCPQKVLVKGTSMTCTGSYTTLATDLPNNIVDTATASGLPSAGSVPDATASATVTFTAQPKWTLTKTPTPTSYNSPNQTINYSYLLTNTGNVAISAIGITDNKVASVTCPATTLAVGANMTCTGSYLTKAADVPNSILNSATATGTAAKGALANATAQASVTFTSQPSMTLTLTPNPTAFTAAGQTINYSYLLTNGGNVAISAIAINDNKNPTVTCPGATLAVGANMTCTAAYVTTAADVTALNVTNNATATGTAAAGALAPAAAQATVNLTPLPSWTLGGSANPSTYSGPGQQIVFSYVVTNTGNVPINSISLDDNLELPGQTLRSVKVTSFVAPISCPATSLVPGQSMMCTHVYVTSANDIAKGNLDVNVQANGTPAAGAVAAVAARIVVALAAGSITIRTVSLGGDATFTYTGTLVTASAIFGSAATAGGNAVVGPASLLPGAYTITQRALAGFNLTGVSCTGDNNGAVVFATRTATINLDGGEAVTCTFFDAGLARPIPALGGGTLLLLSLSVLMLAALGLQRHRYRA